MGKETHFARMRRRLWGSSNTNTKPAAKAISEDSTSTYCDPTVPPTCHETFEEVTIVNSIMKEDDIDIKEVRRRRRSEAAKNISNSNKYLPKLLERSSILHGTDISEISHIVQHIPVRYRNRDFHLVYSTALDGTSLNTMYRNIAGKDPVVLVIKDDSNCVFGAYVSQPFYPQLHYGGTGETFLFDSDNVWKWSRRNKFFYFATHTSLAFGNGTSQASSLSVAGLWFDGDLEYGRTGISDTFNNDLLSEKEEFSIVVAEAYKLVLPKR